jgi:hypothetical protein
MNRIVPWKGAVRGAQAAAGLYASALSASGQERLPRFHGAGAGQYLPGLSRLMGEVCL